MAAKYFIPNAVQTRCKKCHFVLLIENEIEFMFTNVSIIYSDQPNVFNVKCRECKELNTITVCQKK